MLNETWLDEEVMIVVIANDRTEAVPDANTLLLTDVAALKLFRFYFF